MEFKLMSRSLDFADFALSSSLEANRGVKLMEKIELPLTEPVSKRFSCSVIPSAPARKAQKLIRHPPVQMPYAVKMVSHPSDAELKNQINKSLPKKKFLCLS